MKTFEVISDEAAQREYEPQRIPAAVYARFRELFGREPLLNDKTDVLLLMFLDCEGDILTEEFIAEQLETTKKMTQVHVSIARKKLRTREQIFVITKEQKMGWVLEEKKDEVRTILLKQQRVSPPVGEAAQQILREIQEKAGHRLTPSQLAITSVYAEAGKRVPLTYEQVAERSGYPLSTVRVVISGLYISPWIITGAHGEAKYLDCSEENP